MTEEGKVKLNPKNKKLIIIVACIFVVAAIATTVIIVVLSHRETVGDILDLGDRYMSEMDYESAIREYKRAIEIDPKSEDAYLKLAEAYIAIGNRDSAIETLEDGYEATQSDRILERLNELREENVGVEATSTEETDSVATPSPVTEVPVPESIIVATVPKKTTYYVGETLDLTGMTLTVAYSDGTTRDIDEGYTCDLKLLDELGTVEAEIKYSGVETKVVVTVVKAPTSETNAEYIDEISIYNQFLHNGGYEILSGGVFLEEVNSNNFDNNFNLYTCLIDIDNDEIYELFITLEEKSTMRWKTSSLLDIQDNAAEIVFVKDESIGIEMESYNMIKYDSEDKKYVIVEDSYERDPFEGSSSSILTVYSSKDFSAAFKIEKSNFKNNSHIANEIRQKTDLYFEDGEDFWAFSVNGEYVSQSDYNTIVERFTDPTDPKYQMYKGTYECPIFKDDTLK